MCCSPEDGCFYPEPWEPTWVRQLAWDEELNGHEMPSQCILLSFWVELHSHDWWDTVCHHTERLEVLQRRYCPRWTTLSSSRGSIVLILHPKTWIWYTHIHIGKTFIFICIPYSPLSNHWAADQRYFSKYWIKVRSWWLTPGRQWGPVHWIWEKSEILDYVVVFLLCKTWLSRPFLKQNINAGV